MVPYLNGSNFWRCSLCREGSLESFLRYKHAIFFLSEETYEQRWELPTRVKRLARTTSKKNKFLTYLITKEKGQAATNHPITAVYRYVYVFDHFSLCKDARIAQNSSSIPLQQKILREWMCHLQPYFMVMFLYVFVMLPMNCTAIDFWNSN